MFLLYLVLSTISLFLSQSFLVCSSFVPRSADLPLTLALSLPRSPIEEAIEE